RMLFRRVVRVRDRGFRALRPPLLSAGRALRQLPFMFEQIVEEVIAPLCRRLRPGDFRAAGNGVGAETRAVLAPPAKALILDQGGFRLRAEQRRIASAVSF